MDDFREGLGVAALQRPETEPAESEISSGTERGERRERAQPDGRVPEAVGEEEKREREEQAADGAADGDGGVHAPEALFHRGELAAEGFGELAERCGGGRCHGDGGCFVAADVSGAEEGSPNKIEGSGEAPRLKLKAQGKVQAPSLNGRAEKCGRGDGRFGGK